MSGRLVAVLLAVVALVGCGAGSAEPREAVFGEPPAVSMERTEKRGMAWHFCGWGQEDPAADLSTLRQGASWTYNWSNQPMACEGGVADQLVGVPGAPDLEFVPMVWGLVDDGAACDVGGPCFRVDERQGGVSCAEPCGRDDLGPFAPGQACYDCYHESVTRDAFVEGVPSSARYLLGYNEPNFKEQASLTPQAAAAAWRYVEGVADELELGLVGPALNFCDPTPGAHHPGACIEAVDGHAMLGFAWLEMFYDECTAEGAAGYDCRMEHQAAHVYSCWGIGWYLDMFRKKSGDMESEPHCYDGVQSGDEFGVDCGGNACMACSEATRERFRRPLWLTEFAPARDDCGQTGEDWLEQRAAEFAASEIPLLEDDPLVFRYAWFMPRAGHGLEHGSLLDEPGRLTPVGEAYFAPGRAAGD